VTGRCVTTAVTVTKEDQMLPDVDRRETTTSVERAAHAYCALCNPDPQPGEVITALCGASHPFWGRRQRPLHTCEVCHTLASAVIYQCGHAAQAM
jgi:hypothetical protein